MSKNTSHKRLLSSEKKTILVTGANGQLGMTFRKHEKDYQDLNFVFMDAKALDIKNQKAVDRVFEQVKPDYCINCAAYTNVEKAEKEPEKAFLVNAVAVEFLAMACKAQSCILIHISTDYVFDGEKTTPYTTTDTPNPINVYGASKLQGEHNIKKFLSQYFIIRTSWLYSREFGKNFYRTILQKAQTEKELHIVDNQAGCPTDAENLKGYILDLIMNRSDNYGIHHFSDKEVMSWYDFAKLILEENNIQNTILIKNNSYKTKAKRPVYSVLG
ncbi:dTDP-4-dehydrorhamnose reductase [Galbibacter marinus]|uniref:dTDP-4-dehydrorhamnose reductase n=1 Tax=Galbibacter marinus TaxID=555500 RepID=K2Q0N3_9FLAO|nr:dTDP-4-dehydrorhamnose reductase [Galbibacter marinus]EKF54451.1 dTDP-4-dehydrorhamnose reductase [Galbibacter marinus]